MKTDKYIKAWLYTVLVTIFLMVVVGGITRLTHSGLSMVEWKPLFGVIPPLSETAWQETFSKYQQFPQYKLINHKMTLPEFKNIFFWEYIHRLLGRLIGFIFFFPFVFFWIQGRFNNSPFLKFRLGALFLLGGLQGLLGWYMVMSGLIDNPFVSHYRLSAHLCLAVLIYALLFLTILELRPDSVSQFSTPLRKLRVFSLLITAMIFFQIFYGALVAGLKAGHAYNTFPLMLGSLIPPGMFSFPGLLANVLDNPLTVQFIHRCNAWILLFAISGLALFSFRQDSAWCKKNISMLLLLVGIQFALGVFTLLFQVPVSLASHHQAFALILLAQSIRINFHLHKSVHQYTQTKDLL